jgi:hypothetical protein
MTRSIKLSTAEYQIILSALNEAMETWSSEINRLNSDTNPIHFILVKQRYDQTYNLHLKIQEQLLLPFGNND